MGPRRITPLVAAAAFAGLAACQPFGVSPDARTPPSGNAQPAPRPTPSAESLALQAYYARVQADLLRNELLRTDGGGTDTPFGARQLAENFDAIALSTEYSSVAGQIFSRSEPAPLSRWQEPVTLGIEFGPSVSETQRAVDRTTVGALAARLARVTRHPVRLGTPQSANFRILVLNEDERRRIGPQLSELLPGISASAINSVVNLPRSTFCVVLASDPRDDGVYRSAVAVIRAEHPALMRRACFHEEIAQGLGLPNDSPRARPSIFNDDEEFALLTRHDEFLLQILYDPRLKPGMPPETARPIAAQIARELMGGES